MSDQVIRLARHQWTYDDADLLGPPGGFGEVFRGHGADGQVAIKRLRLTAGAAAHRELNIGADLADRQLAHVVPIIDGGQDAESDRYFLVMPVCDYSLQDEINRLGVVAPHEAPRIGLEIAQGLHEVADIVHRDLKPGNVLHHEGQWKIADFGIAKFVEDATSLETLRDSLTPSYAAPEQWRFERPTSATDVYALGCILFSMYRGAPPFVGSFDEVRDGHLQREAARVDEAPAPLRSLIASMLRKTAAARPTIGRCLAVLAVDHQQPVVQARGVLASAADRIAQERAALDAEAERTRLRRESREALYREAIEAWREMFERLQREVRESSDDARIGPDAITLGSAHLTVSHPAFVGEGADGAPSMRTSGWDVVASGIVGLTAFPPRTMDHPYRWSTNVVFADRQDGGGYRWLEVGFFTMGSTANHAPHDVTLAADRFDVAVSRVMGIHHLALGPWPIDGENEDAFIERWLWLVGKAAIGELGHPGQLPVRDGFWT